MAIASDEHRSGLALGAWGAVQATCAGLAIALGALARDLVSAAAVARDLGPTLASPATGYAFVYVRRDRAARRHARRARSAGPAVARPIPSTPPVRPQRISDLKGTAMNLELTAGIDVALLVFYAFVLFFIGLIFYLRREDRREGYPLEDTVTGRHLSPGGPMHTASTQVASCCRSIMARSPRRPRAASRSTSPRGAPIASPARLMPRPAIRWPTASARRPGPIAPSAPIIDMEGHPRIVPLSAADGYRVSDKDPDLDGLAGGRCRRRGRRHRQRPVDRHRRPAGALYPADRRKAAPLLAPMMMAKVDKRRRRVVVDALNAAQFAAAPRPATPGQITLYEEDRVQAYFGGGYLYANASRQEPFL